MANDNADGTLVWAFDYSPVISGMNAMDSFISSKAEALNAKLESFNKKASLGGSLTSDLSAVSAHMGGLEERSKSLMTHLDRMSNMFTGGLGIGVAVGGLALLERSFDKAISKAREFQTAQISIAATLSSSGFRTGPGGAKLSSQDAFNANMKYAQDLQAKLLATSAKNHLTFQEQLGAFQSSVASGLGKGLTVDQIFKLSDVGAMAAKSLGLRGEQIANATRLLMGGGVNVARSTIGRALGISNTDIAARSGETLYKYLDVKLRGFNQAKDEFGSSIEGIISTIESRLDTALAKVGMNFFKAVKPTLEKIIDATASPELRKGESQADYKKRYDTFLQGQVMQAQLTDSLAKGFNGIFKALVKITSSGAFEAFVNFLTFLAGHTDQIVLGAVFINIAKAIKTASTAAKEFMTTLRALDASEALSGGGGGGGNKPSAAAALANIKGNPGHTMRTRAIRGITSGAAAANLISDEEAALNALPLLPEKSELRGKERRAIEKSAAKQALRQRTLAHQSEQLYAKALANMGAIPGIGGLSKAPGSLEEDVLALKHKIGPNTEPFPIPSAYIPRRGINERDLENIAANIAAKPTPLEEFKTRNRGSFRLSRVLDETGRPLSLREQAVGGLDRVANRAGLGMSVALGGSLASDFIPASAKLNFGSYHIPLSTLVSGSATGAGLGYTLGGLPGAAVGATVGGPLASAFEDLRSGAEAAAKSLVALKDTQTRTFEGTRVADANTAYRAATKQALDIYAERVVGGETLTGNRRRQYMKRVQAEYDAAVKQASDIHDKAIATNQQASIYHGYSQGYKAKAALLTAENKELKDYSGNLLEQRTIAINALRIKQANALAEMQTFKERGSAGMDPAIEAMVEGSGAYQALARKARSLPEGSAARKTIEDQMNALYAKGEHDTLVHRKAVLSQGMAGAEAAFGLRAGAAGLLGPTQNKAKELMDKMAGIIDTVTKDIGDIRFGAGKKAIQSALDTMGADVAKDLRDIDQRRLEQVASNQKRQLEESQFAFKRPFQRELLKLQQTEEFPEQQAELAFRKVQLGWEKHQLELDKEGLDLRQQEASIQVKERGLRRAGIGLEATQLGLRETERVQRYQWSVADRPLEQGRANIAASNAANAETLFYGGLGPMSKIAAAIRYKVEAGYAGRFNAQEYEAAYRQQIENQIAGMRIDAEASRRKADRLPAEFKMQDQQEAVAEQEYQMALYRLGLEKARADLEQQQATLEQKRLQIDAEELAMRPRELALKQRELGTDQKKLNLTQGMAARDLEFFDQETVATISSFKAMNTAARNAAIALDRAAAEIAGESSALRTVKKTLPHRAKGGPVWPGQPFIVGEQGEELFIPNQPGKIISHDAYNKMAAEYFSQFGYYDPNGSSNGITQGLRDAKGHVLSGSWNTVAAINAMAQRRVDNAVAPVYQLPDNTHTMAGKSASGDAQNGTNYNITVNIDGKAASSNDKELFDAIKRYCDGLARKPH